MIYKINKNVLIEESLLNHIRDNKNAYAVGAAGLGAAGLGTYLAMSSGDHTVLETLESYIATKNRNANN
jgi:hypothetical protein